MCWMPFPVAPFGSPQVKQPVALAPTRNYRLYGADVQKVFSFGRRFVYILLTGIVNIFLASVAAAFWKRVHPLAGEQVCSLLGGYHVTRGMEGPGGLPCASGRRETAGRAERLLFGSAAWHPERTDPRRGIGCILLVIGAEVPKGAIVAGIHRGGCVIHPPGCAGLGCLTLH